MSVSSQRAREAHVELLLGASVCDAAGERLGRIEEFCAEMREGRLVVVEVHVGPAALLERIGGFALQLPILRRLPFRRKEYRIPWHDIDLCAPAGPRTKRRREELRRLSRQR